MGAFGLLALGFLTACWRPPEERFAFIHVNLVPMTREEILTDQTVLVEAGEIVAVGASRAVQIPPGGRVVDGTGAYLMPGLADMHMHTRQDWEDQAVWPVDPLGLYLANGVTTIRDFAPHGSPITYALEWRSAIEAGTRAGPTIYASGTLLYASPLKEPEDIVRHNHDVGFDFLKLYSYLSVDDFHRAMATAHQLGMYTSGHIPYAVGLEGVLSEGMAEIAHVEELLPEFVDFDRSQDLTSETWLPYLVDSALAQWDLTRPSAAVYFQAEHTADLERITHQLQAADTAVCTTMVIDDVIQWKLARPEAFLERPEMRYLPASYRASVARGEDKHQLQFAGIEELAAFKYAIDRWLLSGLHDADILLLLGTDAGTGGMGIVPGYAVHDELESLVENGFSPYEAITAGTVNAAIVARKMTGDGDFGTIEAGKRADLILVRGNPLEDVRAIRDPLGVMAAGRWYPKETLDRMLEGTQHGR